MSTSYMQYVREDAPYVFCDPDTDVRKISVGTLHATSLEKCSCRFQLLISPAETTLETNPIN